MAQGQLAQNAHCQVEGHRHNDIGADGHQHAGEGAVKQAQPPFLGGILLGVIESLAKAYISTQLANAILFAVLIIVLLVKPSGLLGRYVPEKV